MRTAFALLAFVLPMTAAAVPCQYGCRGCPGGGTPANVDLVTVTPYNLPLLGQQINRPTTPRPRLFTAGPSGTPSDQVVTPYGTCDDLNMVVGPGDSFGSYLQRDANGARLAWHRLDVDASGYIGNADPISGMRSWWPGVVSWIIPMAHGGYAELRVDYSSSNSGHGWSLVGRQLRLLLDGVHYDGMPLSSDQFAIELQWSAAGDVVVFVADLDADGNPGVVTPFPIVGTATENFQPLHYLVGRRGSYEFRWSRGQLRISSDYVFRP